MRKAFYFIMVMTMIITSFLNLAEILRMLVVKTIIEMEILYFKMAKDYPNYPT